MFAFYKHIGYIKFTLKNKNFKSNPDIVVCGLNRSGSTLLYNIILLILKKTYNPSLGFFSNEQDYFTKLNHPNYLVLRKTHNFSLILKKRIKNGQTIGFFTHRNLLDIIASHIQNGWIKNLKLYVEKNGIERLVNKAILISRIKNIFIFSYDDLINRKEMIIKNICQKLNVELTENDIKEIIEETSIEKTKAKISDMSFEKIKDKKFNIETGLHKNHINDPKTGKWKKILKDDDIQLIKNRKAFNIYNTFFNY